GVTLLGVRYRHEVCDRWLREEKDIEYVLCHLSDANFDPEFFRHYENYLVEEYNAKSGKQLQLKKRSWKRIFQGIGK
ncbi:MAG TPA: NAD(P)/FAD-dependent oxidoreductase, partial [Flavobacteriales bacterium]|nr:NAD(P)/FAD-dependent oxidoreductase [Flavobacteriales bacterium]